MGKEIDQFIQYQESKSKKKKSDCWREAVQSSINEKECT